MGRQRPVRATRPDPILLNSFHPVRRIATASDSTDGSEPRVDRGSAAICPSANGGFPAGYTPRVCHSAGSVTAFFQVVLLSFLFRRLPYARHRLAGTVPSRSYAWPARSRGVQPAAHHTTLSGVGGCFRLFAFRLCRSACNPVRFGCPRTGVNAIGGTASKSDVLQLATRANALFSAVLSTPTRRNQQSAYCANRYNCDIIVT